MKGGYLHNMLTSLVDYTLGEEFSKLGEGDEFTWNQFHVEDWGERDFEGNGPATLNNSTGRAVPLTCLLLDSQSIVDLIINIKMLENIGTVWGGDAIRVHCNSGVKSFNRIANLPRYRTVWYKLTGISNILSMSRATKTFQGVFDSEGEKIFRMVLPDRELKFQLTPNRIYYFDAVEREISVLLINTVLENREGFERRESWGGREEQQAMHLIVLLSERDFGNIVRSNTIVNFPLNFDDVKNSKLIFGPGVTSLKLKPARRNPASVVTNYFEIPMEILELCKELEVSMDIMSVKKIMFLVSICLGLKFTIIEYLSGNSEISLVNYINKIFSYYNSHSLYIRMIFVDPNFQFLEDKVVSKSLNTTGVCDNVPEVER